MKLMFFLFLAGYAVKCEDGNNYYVVQMPEEDTPAELPTRSIPLQVYWNVPTMQCTSKKILFKNLFEKFGIIQNTNDSFRGENIAILYDPGYFPALFRNESNAKLRYRNGGVPQEGSLQLHLKSFTKVLEQSIPDRSFNGIGIIDFESWRPILRQNFGEVLPYKAISYQIERERHWWWPQTWINEEAKQRFEEAARLFMQNTIAAAKRLRPHARWGYYGFPYCFNMAVKNMGEDCAKNVNLENDQIDWLWSESSALYPSVYSFKDLTTSQLSQLIAGRVREAARVRRRDTPILPYFWFRYRDGEFLREVDLHEALKTFNSSEAAGFIIWGSSNDVNTVDKCHKLYNYIDNVLGPAVAIYTKRTSKVSNTTLNDYDEFAFYSNESTTNSILDEILSTNVIDNTEEYTIDTTSTTVSYDNTESDFNVIEMQNFADTNRIAGFKDTTEYAFGKYANNYAGVNHNDDFGEKQKDFGKDDEVFTGINESSLLELLEKTFTDPSDSNEDGGDRFDYTMADVGKETTNTPDLMSSEVEYDYEIESAPYLKKSPNVKKRKYRKKYKTSTTGTNDTVVLHILDLSRKLATHDLETSTYLGTDSPLLLLSKDRKKGKPKHEENFVFKTAETTLSSNSDEFTSDVTDQFQTSTHTITKLTKDSKTRRKFLPVTVRNKASNITTEYKDFTTTEGTFSTTENIVNEAGNSTDSFNLFFYNQDNFFDPRNFTDSPVDLKTGTTDFTMSEDSHDNNTENPLTTKGYSPENTKTTPISERITSTELPENTTESIEATSQNSNKEKAKSINETKDVQLETTTPESLESSSTLDQVESVASSSTLDQVVAQIV